MSEQINSFVKDQYKFGLYLNDSPILERVFRADVYNVKSRNLNLKDVANDIIKGLRDILSTNDSNLNIDKYLKTYKEDVKFFGLSKEHDKSVRTPLSFEQEALNNTNGYYLNNNENFKYILYYNGNYVIERNFCVKNYNPNARFSAELTNYFNDIVKYIELHIKQKDSDFMWGEYSIRNRHGFDIDTIRQFNAEQKEKMLVEPII
jgi:hypothetical protein